MSDGDMVEAVAGAIREYFLTSTGFQTEDSEGCVSAYYGRHWIVLSPTELARAALSVIESRVRAEERERAARIAEAEMAKCNLYVERKLGGDQGVEKNTARYQTARSIAAAIRSGSEG